MPDWAYKIVYKDSSNDPDMLVEQWEYWPYPKWCWRVSRPVSQGLNQRGQVSLTEETPWRWSISLERRDFEKFHDTGPWLICGDEPSEEEAKRNCERAGPIFYDFWVSMQSDN